MAEAHPHVLYLLRIRCGMGAKAVPINSIRLK
jgi:hypothetical protein